MKKTAVIVAGGNGVRMGSAVPKQFLKLKGKPVLYYTIKAFLESYDDLDIILVLPEEHIGSGQELIDAYFDHKRIRITSGGRTRFHSVQQGLRLIEEECIVLVHDAVRCLVTPKLIQSCCEAVLEYGSAVPVIPVSDSIRRISEDGSEVVDRSELRAVQTPQAFYSKMIIPAFNIDFKDRFTDEATVLEAFGMKVHLVDGSEENLKITKPVDLQIAEKFLDERGA